MTETDADLHDAFEEATTTAERVHDDDDVGAGDDPLPDEQAETLRESTERLAAAVSEASLEELLDATGFDDVPDDASPVDLPAVIRDADPAAIVELRTLLQLADLGESWSDLSDEERTDRLNRVVGEESDGEGGFAQLKEYLDQFGHLVGGEGDGEPSDDESGAESGDAADDGEPTASAEGEATAAAESAADGAAASGEDADGDAEEDDDELVQLEEHLGRLKQLVGDDDSEAAEADAEADTEATASDDAAEAADAAEADAVAADEKTADDGADTTEADADAADNRADAADGQSDGTDDRRQSATGSSSRLSTVPSSRADMGKSTRYSSIRGRK